jgi:hypothetical protein
MMAARQPGQGRDRADPSFWQRIETLFHAALERPREERRRYVELASAGDVSIAAEVDRMLSDASEAKRRRFLDVA